MENAVTQTTSPDNMQRQFLQGLVKDSTTKDSRKVDRTLAVLKTMQRNLLWTPTDHASKKIKTMKAEDINKLLVVSGNSLSSNSSALSLSQSQQNQPQNRGRHSSVLLEVEADIHRRIHSMGLQGQCFEPEALFEMDQQLAADAEYLVQGVDPQAARSAERFASSRKITVQRKHWVAYKQGYMMTPYGIAYVHTDGSIAIFQHGKATECPCGAVHMA